MNFVSQLVVKRKTKAFKFLHIKFIFMYLKKMTRFSNVLHFPLFLVKSLSIAEMCSISENQAMYKCQL